MVLETRVQFQIETYQRVKKKKKKKKKKLLDAALLRLSTKKVKIKGKVEGILPLHSSVIVIEKAGWLGVMAYQPL